MRVKESRNGVSIWYWRLCPIAIIPSGADALCCDAQLPAHAAACRASVATAGIAAARPPRRPRPPIDAAGAAAGSHAAAAQVQVPARHEEKVLLCEKVLHSREQAQAALEEVLQAQDVQMQADQGEAAAKGSTEAPARHASDPQPATRHPSA